MRGEPWMLSTLTTGVVAGVALPQLGQAAQAGAAPPPLQGRADQRGLNRCGRTAG